MTSVRQVKLMFGQDVGQDLQKCCENSANLRAPCFIGNDPLAL